MKTSSLLVYDAQPFPFVIRWYSAAPQGASANAGSLRTIGNELAQLEDLARVDMAASNGHQHYSDAPKDPMLLIESERR